ncbi:hypothetical protein GWI33_015267 [Rhynchophorus ferrugineus]|uniref:Uncharacterized protein n=1 Tax=Rhynchophorus ferrugineus TaxID=354439 RepID=A0A834M4N6_RHYFE|nr:hypothetical protein GWI33_015267 [Rhynchophorus ferrugineus]
MAAAQYALHHRGSESCPSPILLSSAGRQELCPSHGEPGVLIYAVTSQFGGDDDHGVWVRDLGEVTATMPSRYRGRESPYLKIVFDC